MQARLIVGTRIALCTLFFASNKRWNRTEAIMKFDLILFFFVTYPCYPCIVRIIIRLVSNLFKKSLLLMSPRNYNQINCMSSTTATQAIPRATVDGLPRNTHRVIQCHGQCRQLPVLLRRPSNGADKFDCRRMMRSFTSSRRLTQVQF